LKYPELPLINVGIDKPIWFPPEILEVLPGQIFREKINDNQTKVMINHACNSPKFNAELIENVGLPRLGLKGANSQLVLYRTPVVPDVSANSDVRIPLVSVLVQKWWRFLQGI
jgi:hypothetical protein